MAQGISNTAIKAVMIADRAGCPLVSVVLSPIFNLELLGGFIAAIGHFADEVIHQIEEISIKGLSVVLFVAFKNNLFIAAAMDEKVSRGNIRAEAELALDAFYDQYKDLLEKWDGDRCAFQEFEKQLQHQIAEYLARPSTSTSDQPSSRLLSRMLSFFRGKSG